MSSIQYPLEIMRGVVDEFTYELNGDQIEVLEHNMAHVVNEFETQWHVMRDTEHNSRDVNLVLSAYAELKPTNPHLALSMIAWFLAEQSTSMDDSRRRGVKTGLRTLVNNKLIISQNFLIDKPNVNTVYQRTLQPIQLR